jgi:hypothetical protein
MQTRDSSTVGSGKLTTPVLLVTIATNSTKASIFYRAVRVLYNRQQQRAPVSRSPKLIYVSRSPESVSGIRVSQSPEAEGFSPRSERSVVYNSVSGIQEATSAIVVSVIVTCCSCNLHRG